jgi:hypothetical protein
MDGGLMEKKLNHGDKIQFNSDYVEGDLVKYARVPKSGYRRESRTEYSRIKFVQASIDSENKLYLKYKLENGHVVEHIDILCVEKKATVKK